MKIRIARAQLFPADGQMDRPDETNSRLSQFCAFGQGEISAVCKRSLNSVRLYTTLMKS